MSYRMNSATNISPSLYAKKKENCLWVNTYFLSTTYILTQNNYAEQWNSGRFFPQYFNIELSFQVDRIGKKEFKLTCMQNPTIKLYDEYALEFYCSVNVLDQDPKLSVIRSNRNMIVQVYNLNTSFCQCLKSSANTTNLELKILVKMIESNLKLCLRRNKQEKDFNKIKEDFVKDESVLNDMGYILHNPGIQNTIFSGLQSNHFAGNKSTYIARTAVFSREIATYMKAKDAGRPVPLTNLGLILNYIHNGDQVIISDDDLFNLYHQAHHMGLIFLVDLSRDAIVNRVGNQNFVLNALKAAEFVNDKILFDKVLENSHSSESELLHSENLRLRERSDIDKIQWRFLAHTLERRMNQRNNHVKTRDSSQPSTSK